MENKYTKIFRDIQTDPEYRGEQFLLQLHQELLKAYYSHEESVEGLADRSGISYERIQGLLYAPDVADIPELCVLAHLLEKEPVVFLNSISTTVYKLVRLDPCYGIQTLFHAWNGCRILPVNQWLKAEKKPVQDGSGGTEYVSGWTVFLTKNKAKKYKKKFREPPAVIECAAQGIWEKEHSPHEVYLAEWLRIPSGALSEEET